MKIIIYVLVILSLPQKIFADDSGDILKYMQNNGYGEPVDDSEVFKDANAFPLPKEISYFNFWFDQKLLKVDQKLPPARDVFNFLISQASADDSNLANYESARDETTMVCSFNEDEYFNNDGDEISVSPEIQTISKKCNLILTHIEEIDTLLDQYDNDELGDVEILDQRSALEILSGVSLKGKDYYEKIVDTADPHSELREESDGSTGRFSLLNNSAHYPDAIINPDYSSAKTLEQTLCLIEQEIQKNTRSELLDFMIKDIEIIYLQQNISIIEKERIFCDLKQYYDLFDMGLDRQELILFDPPPGENLCKDLP